MSPPRQVAAHALARADGLVGKVSTRTCTLTLPLIRFMLWLFKSLSGGLVAKCARTGPSERGPLAAPVWTTLYAIHR